MRHIDHIVSLTGVDHAGLGIDYFTGQAPYASDATMAAYYRDLVGRGLWSPKAYPPPPYHYPAEIATPDLLPNLTERLLDRGYDVAAVAKILSGNWLRVFSAVWGE